MIFFVILIACICIDGRPVRRARNSHPKLGNLTYYRNHFLFVKYRDVTPVGGAKGTPGTSKCPWDWGYEIDRTRTPSIITVAKCPTCDMTKCKAVHYSHHVLVQSHKDRRTGENVWTWKLVNKPIAYVYII